MATRKKNQAKDDPSAKTQPPDELDPSSASSEEDEALEPELLDDDDDEFDGDDEFDDDDDDEFDGDDEFSTHTPVKRGGTTLPKKMSALDVYLAELRDVEIVDIAEQAKLAVRYQQYDDQEAAARLVASNLRLVVKIAFQFRRQWADVMDLIAEGNVGLAEAIRKFDADKNIPFPSYARYWIRAKILAYIQENKHLIYTGTRAARKLFWRLDRERRKLQAQGIDANPALIAEKVGVQEQDVLELAPILDQRAMSLDVPVLGEDGGRSRKDSLEDVAMSSPEQNASDFEVHELIQEAFEAFRNTLNDRDKVLWDERLQSADPQKLEDLGNRFGVSKERIRQLEVRIKERLKTFLEEHLDDDVIIEAIQ